MSAGDALSGQQFFHGTNVQFRPGDVLEPGHEPNWDYSGASAGNKVVWLHNNPERASEYGRHVYEVAPHTPPENYDEGQLPPHESEFATSRATVRRSVAPNERFASQYWTGSEYADRRLKTP